MYMYLFQNYIKNINLNEHFETFHEVQDLELWFTVYSQLYV